MKRTMTARSRLGAFANVSRLQSDREAYDMAVSRDVELKSLRAALFQAQEAAKKIAADFDAIKADAEKLRAVAKAAAQLCDNVEEYDCDGIGLFAEHGWWEPLYDALEALNANKGE